MARLRQLPPAPREMQRDKANGHKIPKGDRGQAASDFFLILRYFIHISRFQKAFGLGLSWNREACRFFGAPGFPTGS